MASVGIRALTWSSFSHVEAVDYPFATGHEVFGASLKHGVSYVPLEERVRQSSLLGVYRIQCTDEQRARFWIFLWRQQGKGYDWSALVGIPMRRNFQQDDRWFCAELIAAACEYADIQMVNKQLWRVTPQNLIESVRGTLVWTGKNEVKF